MTHHDDHTSHGTTTHGTGRDVPLVGKAAGLVGAVFLLVGILGFVPGVTTNFSELSFASHDSEAKLLGIFQVSVLHNVVHLLFGVIGLAVAKKAAAARSYLLVGGAVYLVLFVYGLVIDKTSPANFVPVNRADDLLHLVLGLGMIALALLTDRRHKVGAGHPA